jgi:radical SAM protein with 4Fe4S-binding SPASM domain
MDLTPVEKALTSKTFCTYPWIHQYVGPDGEVKPCCIYKPNESGVGNIKDASLSEIWNNDKSKQMRLDMLNGVEIAGCSICNNRSGSSITHRDETNASWFRNNVDIINQTHSDGFLPGHKLKYIDARFNNLCNLKCRTCTPHFSTSWHADYEKLRNPTEFNNYPKALLIPGNSDDHLLNEILPHLSEANRIYFAGGEPLMQIEHYKVLEELINLKHTGTILKPLIIQYSTNFSSLTLGKHNVIDYWNKFTKVIVNASLDGSHARGEYWRKGTNWSTIVENRKALIKNCPRVMFNIGFTLSWVNAFNLLDFHKEWVNLKYINVDSINVNMLDMPAMYSLKNIPSWKKKKIELAFLKHIEWLTEKKARDQTKNQFVNAINFMNGVDTGNNFIDLIKFLDTTEQLDKLRNENFWDVFPEHTDMKELIYGSNSVQKLPSTNE